MLRVRNLWGFQDGFKLNSEVGTCGGRFVLLAEAFAELIPSESGNVQHTQVIFPNAFPEYS